MVGFHVFDAISGMKKKPLRVYKVPSSSLQIVTYGILHVFIFL